MTSAIRGSVFGEGKRTEGEAVLNRFAAGAKTFRPCNSRTLKAEKILRLGGHVPKLERAQQHIRSAGEHNEIRHHTPSLAEGRELPYMLRTYFFPRPLKFATAERVYQC